MRHRAWLVRFVFGAVACSAITYGQEPAGPSLPKQPAGPGGGLSPYASLPSLPARPNALDKLTPASDALLIHPPDSDWLTWRRTYDDVGFSPLKQIEKGNAGKLRVAWTWSLSAGASEFTPLVHDGVMFVFGFGDRVQAIDAATGDLLWHYARELPKDAMPSVKRNISLYGDKVFFESSDGHIVALDYKTGRPPSQKEADKSLQPTPKQEVGFVEDHPGDEDRTEQADDRCSDGSVGNDDADDRRQNAENDLHGIGAEQHIWFGKGRRQPTDLTQCRVDRVLNFLS